MDFSNFLCQSSILNRLNKSIIEKEENVFFLQHNSRSKFLYSCFPQSFSLPDSIIFYISKNPATAKLYKKLIQTCKHFFIKNPIIVSPNFPYSLDFDKWCIGKTRFNLSQLICKYWITGNFNSKSILTKLYKCDAKIITLKYKVISFNDLSMLTKSAEDINFETVTVKDCDDLTVPFEKIFEACVNVKTFRFYSYSKNRPNFTLKTFNELLKIPHFSKLELIYLNNIPESFDIETFYVYMKKNKTFRLEFDSSISVPYKNRLEEIIDELLGTKDFNYKPPFINFDGLENEKKLRLLCIHLV